MQDLYSYKKRIKIIFKVVFIIVAFYIVFYIFMLASCSKNYEVSDLNYFEPEINEVYGAKQHIPNINSLGKYKSTILKRKETQYFLWNINAISLIVEYDLKNFELEYNNIYLNYSFLEETKEDLYDYYAIVNDYKIQIVDKIEKREENYSYDYPKCFMMIGICEEKQSVIYMYHYDIDLDEIKDLDSYIKKYYNL